MKYVWRTVLWAFMLLGLLFTLFPIVITILGSFKTNAELTAGATILPLSWTFSNYAEAWTQGGFSTYSFNSLFVAAASTAGTLIVSSMAAYVVNRMSFIGKKIFVGIQAFTMFVSIGAVVLRPQFELMIDLKLHNSLWGVILILISAHASAFFILLSFMSGIPRELDEAARIDGCSQGSIYMRIVLPLLTPGLGVAGLFAFRGA